MIMCLQLARGHVANPSVISQINWWFSNRRLHILGFRSCLVPEVPLFQKTVCASPPQHHYGTLTYVMMRVSSPGSPKTPSTNSGRDVKLYLLQDLPSSKLNLEEKAELVSYFLILLFYSRGFSSPLQLLWRSGKQLLLLDSDSSVL